MWEGQKWAAEFAKSEIFFANSESFRIENYWGMPFIQAVTVLPVCCLNTALKVL